MNKNEIYIKSGTNYKEMTKELLAQCGLASVISDKKMQIGIKLILYHLPRFMGSYHTSGNCGGNY